MIKIGGSTVKLDNYHLVDEENIISPALIYYKDAIIENTKHTIELATDVNRLWYHVKTHKCRELVKMQMEMGFTHFMCATIAEAEMAASVGAQEVILAYALVGPNIKRFVNMVAGMQGTHFWALGDDYEQIKKLSEAATEKGVAFPLLIDVNVGQNRTGITLGAVEALYAKCAGLPNVTIRGLHCYDGHNHQTDVSERQAAVDKMDAEIEKVRVNVESKGYICDTIIVGGTPSFPCHAKASKYFLSPGTSFVMDARYGREDPDLQLKEAGAILTRVVSHPAYNTFTLDLGSKGISCDQPVRGEIVGVNASAMFQSEEHWLWKMDEGHESERPAIGDIVFVIPSHICPTTVLYDKILVAESGKIVGEWETVARKRKLTY